MEFRLESQYVKRVLWDDVSTRKLEMVGDSTCVAQNHRQVEIDAPPGERRWKYEPSGFPYISFVSVRSVDEYGRAYIYETEPVVGGINLAFAKKIHEELGLAIKRMEELEYGN